MPAQVRFKGERELFDVSLYFYLDFNDQNEDVIKNLFTFEDTKYGPSD